MQEKVGNWHPMQDVVRAKLQEIIKLHTHHTRQVETRGNSLCQRMSSCAHATH